MLVRPACAKVAALLRSLCNRPQAAALRSLHLSSARPLASLAAPLTTDPSRRTRWMARPHTSHLLSQTRVPAPVQGAHLPAWSSRDHGCAPQLRLTTPSHLAPLLHPRSQASAPPLLTPVPARHMREQLSAARVGAHFLLRGHLQPENLKCRVGLLEAVHQARRTPQQTRRAPLQSMQQAGRLVARTARRQPCLLLARRRAAPRAPACRALRARPTARSTRPCARWKARCAPSPRSAGQAPRSVHPARSPRLPRRVACPAVALWHVASMEYWLGVVHGQPLPDLVMHMSPPGTEMRRVAAVSSPAGLGRANAQVAAASSALAETSDRWDVMAAHLKHIQAGP